MFRSVSDPEPRFNLSEVIAVVVVLAVGVLILTLYLSTPQNVPRSIADGNLKIRARIWNQDFPLRDLETSQTQVLNLELDPTWRPQFKERSYSGFGYRAGRFSLKWPRGGSLSCERSRGGVDPPERRRACDGRRARPCMPDLP